MFSSSSTIATTLFAGRIRVIVASGCGARRNGGARPRLARPGQDRAHLLQIDLPLEELPHRECFFAIARLDRRGAADLLVAQRELPAAVPARRFERIVR